MSTVLPSSYLSSEGLESTVVQSSCLSSDGRDVRRCAELLSVIEDRKSNIMQSSCQMDRMSTVQQSSRQ